MPLLFSSSFILPSCHFHQFKVHDLQGNAPSRSLRTFVHYNNSGELFSSTKDITRIFRNKQPSTLKFIVSECMNSSNGLFAEESTANHDWKNQEQEDMGSPWEGAVVYRRNPSMSHVEYCTTLERLGLGTLSTKVSKSRASLMGLRVTKDVKDYPLGTPVLISVDVTRKKHKSRLDGIIKTVLTLACNRCAEPAAECVFSNFSLLLMEEPIEEPEVINMGVIFGEDKFKTWGDTAEKEKDDEVSVDLDDRLYFPPEMKTIDISKHIRDMVHLEITINALCDLSCKGLCLKCGTNLNTSRCNCNKRAVKHKSGPLGDLRKRMQQT